MRKSKLVFGLGLVLTLTACGTTAIGGASIEGAWGLESATWDGQDLALVDTHPVTLTLDGETAGGTAACNSYGGEYTLTGDQIRFINFGWTEMACMPAEVMELEQAYLNALLNVETAQVVDGELVLTGSRSELTFIELEPVPTAELQGTVWELESVVQGESVSSVAGDPATLELLSDGSLRGSTGCRTLSGEYQIAGAEVLFTTFSAEGDCPPELEQQDNQVVTVLGDGFRPTIDGDVLTLTSMGGDGLVYRQAP